MTKGKPNETQRYVFLVSVDKALENRYCSSNWSLLQYTARSYNSITIQHDICVTKEEQTTLKNCKSPNCDVIQWLLHIFPLWVLLLNRKLVNFFASGTVSAIMHQLWTIKLEEHVFFYTIINTGLHIYIEIVLKEETQEYNIWSQLATRSRH